jgi:hypothetical protein
MWWCGVDGLIQVIAAQFKPDTERLADFVRSQGGTNECATQ